MPDELKSALELALEKLGASEEPVTRLSEDQKAEIAEIRSRYKAKLAEAEIGAKSRIREAAMQGDAEKLRQLETDLVEERKRLNAQMEEAVEKVRSKEN